MNCERVQVSPQQRDQAKKILYGILYGQGVPSLAKELKVSLSDASRFLKSFKCVSFQCFGMSFFFRVFEMCLRSAGYVPFLQWDARYGWDISVSCLWKQEVHVRVAGAEYYESFTERICEIKKELRGSSRASSVFDFNALACLLPFGVLKCACMRLAGFWKSVWLVLFIVAMRRML